MRKELRSDLSKILVYVLLINLIGWLSVLIWGWKIGILIGLIVLLIVLLMIHITNKQTP